jgi:hypothetical protein
MHIQSSPEKQEAKLNQLVESEGYNDPTDMLRDALSDGLCPSICMNDGCDYTANYEGDCREGWCERCCDHTVASALVLAGII